MEKNHKNTDCYFFYYSTCTRGDSCAYRHEASALGCETVCSYWQQGSCLNQHCNFRHMEIKKNRKVIPCYWEKFPTGCKKPHCPFLHRQNRNLANPTEQVNGQAQLRKSTGPAQAKPANQEWTNRPDAKFDGNSTESEQNRNSSEAGSFIGSPAVVDPLIVNFEEESDTESAPSPMKSRRNRVSSCKTYEEIRLEEIQAESAAFYSYAELHQPYPESPDAGGGKIIGGSSARSQRLAAVVASSVYEPPEPKEDELNFEILSLDEIRRRRRKKREDEPPLETEMTNVDVIKDAIKTLDELKDANPSSSSSSTCQATLIERRKRSFERKDVEEDEKEERLGPKKAKRSETTKPRPIRLKRRIVTTTTVPTEDEQQKDDSEKQKPKETSGSRRQSVEVRVCDSSTDDNSHSQQHQEQTSTREEVTAATEKVEAESVEPISATMVKLDASEDDDILKDIDALLS